MEEQRTAHSKHIHLLDGLRGYAAFAVILTHIMFLFDHRLPVEAGILAVDLFFIMSGLVIAKSYGEQLRSGAMSFRDFLRKRLVRLYPLYLLGALIGFLTYLRGIPPSHFHQTLLGSLASTISMLPQFLFGIPNNTFSYNQPAWSLSVEMYGNLAFALLGVRLSNRGLVLTTLISFCIYAVVVWRLATLNLGFAQSNYVVSYARFWYGFSAGVLIWRLRDRLPRFGPVGPLLVLLVLYFPNLPASNLVRFGWVTLLMPLAIMAAMQIQVSSSGAAICSFLGKISYPLYITHVPVLNLTVSVLAKIWGMGVWTSPVAGLIALAVILVVATLTTYYVEPPMRRGFDWLLSRIGSRPRSIPSPK